MIRSVSTTMRRTSVERLTAQTQFWDDLGQIDPLYAVLSDPAKRMGGWNLDEFFATGDKEIDLVMQRSRALSHPMSRHLALDFGCGVGRLTRALCKYFDKCYGVDIAQSMIAKARDLNRETPNCEFLLNTEDNLHLFPSDHFDMIYTRLVLQHITDRSVVMSYIGEFIRTLTRGGLLVFQMPCYIPIVGMIQPRPRIYSVLSRAGFDRKLLYETLGLTPIRMNFIPEMEMKRYIQSVGGAILTSETTRNPGPFRTESCTYFVTK